MCRSHSPEDCRNGSCLVDENRRKKVKGRTFSVMLEVCRDIIYGKIQKESLCGK